MNELSSVLLIEDNPGDIRLVQEHLGERLGAQCRFHAADTLHDGLQWLDTQTADVILLDLTLPDSEGLATYLKVLERAPRTPVVILSGHDDEELARDAVRAGAQDYLTKRDADGVSLARTVRHAVERRRCEHALRESEARFRGIVETAEEGILQLDAQGCIRFFNTRMARMLGLPAHTLLGRSFVELVQDDYRALARHLLDSTVPSGRGTAELRLVRRDDAPLWAMVAAGAIRIPGSELYERVVMLTDITGRVLAEQELVGIARELEQRVAQRTAQLEAANAELAMFNTSIAHDLRTPLNTVLGFATLLERDAGDALSVAQRKQLHLIQNGARDMNKLIGGLLALSGIGRSEVKRQPLDLSALATSVIDQLRQQTEPPRTVEVVIEPGLQAHGDPVLVKSLLDNLLGNAWKYTARTNLAWLRFGLARRTTDETVYVVQDNGVGFDMRSANKLFTPFERLESGKAFAGTGIGLASARRIVERHGGRIWAQSSPGDRTGFFFTLGAPIVRP